MSKPTRSALRVLGTSIGMLTQPGGDSVLVLGVWERINNPGFHSLTCEWTKPIAICRQQS